jgi:hypothetical protein
MQFFTPLLTNGALIRRLGEKKLYEINAKLLEQGYPKYYLGNTFDFNRDYRLIQTPRFVWWRLKEFYLWYIPEDKEITTRF